VAAVVLAGGRGRARGVATRSDGGSGPNFRPAVSVLIEECRVLAVTVIKPPCCVRCCIFGREGGGKGALESSSGRERSTESKAGVQDDGDVVGGAGGVYCAYAVVAHSLAQTTCIRGGLGSLLGALKQCRDGSSTGGVGLALGAGGVAERPLSVMSSPCRVTAGRLLDDKRRTDDGKSDMRLQNRPLISQTTKPLRWEFEVSPAQSPCRSLAFPLPVLCPSNREARNNENEGE
jgi:hypothetical protein